MNLHPCVCTNTRRCVECGKRMRMSEDEAQNEE